MGETINQTVEALEGFICWTITAFMKVQYGLPRVLGSGILRVPLSSSLRVPEGLEKLKRRGVGPGFSYSGGEASGVL